MGTQTSKSEDNLLKSKHGLDPSTMSSYNGMKSETSSSTSIKKAKRKNSFTSISETTTKNQTQTTISQDNKVPFKFEWKEGGNKVTITGSFLANWTMFIEMVKNPKTGFFEFNINLPREIHQFKFIIDGVWKCSNNYPKINDGHNNINNQIDLTNYKSETNSEKENEENKNIKEYNCYNPKRDEMNSDAPNIPLHYFKPYVIDYNTHQFEIGNANFLKVHEKNLLSDNNSYKSIMIYPHVNLNHICSCCHCSNDCNYIRTALSQKFKNKCLTVIFYTPKKKI